MAKRHLCNYQLHTHNSTIGEICYFVARRIQKAVMADFVRPSAHWNLVGPPSGMLIDPERIGQRKISWIEQPGEA
jgi:hypothetical protein